MSKREYRPKREHEPVGMIDGWPDHRGLPTVRVVCEGWPSKGTAHKETVVATFQCLPFDPSKGECGNWFWDQSVATGGGARHATTRLREDKSKRRVTDEEEERGWRPGFVEVGPKRFVASPDSRITVHLDCPRCSSDLHIKDAALQDVLDRMVTTTADDVGAELAPILHLGARKLPLPALIALQTQPKSR